LLAQIDCLDVSIARFTAQIQTTCAQDAGEAEVVASLDSIHALSNTVAQIAVAAWVDLAPGHDERAGRPAE
jgi:spore cortex formation protein SpoVR/YcgB (stage V sporulation)